MADLRYKSDDESSEEGQLHDDTEDFPEYPQKNIQKGGGQLWKELIQAENLEEGLKTMQPIDTNPSTSDSTLIERGAESFQIPANPEFEDETPVFKGKKKSVNVNADDLFFCNDLQAEDFGVSSAVVRKQPELRSVHERYEPTGKREQRRWKRFQRIKEKNSGTGVDNEAVPQNRKRRMNDAVSMESLASINSSQSGQSTSNIGIRANTKKRRKQKPDNTTLRQDFSAAKLFTSSIPTDLSVEDTGERIATELGERDTAPVKFAVSVIGIENSLELFDSTVKKEQNGGLQVKGGGRRRTPGGVFFELLKTSDNIGEEEKKKVYEFSRDYFKSKRGTGA